MSAAVLREAAALMRERAEADGSRGWIKVDFNEGDDPAYRPLWGVANEPFFNPPADEDEPWLAVEVHTGTEATAEHIASWQPAVALAVADWLDATAAEHESDAADPRVNSFFAAFDTAADVAAIAVATAYLGEQS